LRYGIFRGSLALALAQVGQVLKGLATIEEALAWTERTEELWVIAELLRIKGELLLLQGAQEPRQGPRITSGERSTGRAGKAPCHGNYAEPLVSVGSCEIRVVPLTA
jgi:hypothetical protein